MMLISIHLAECGPSLPSARAQAVFENGQWAVKKAVMSRSARVLMEGWVRIPQDVLK
jgi:2-methylaconitate cis-trans-isomerase PrpF